jgi:ElaA protein
VICDRSFDELSTVELYELLRLRSAVFVVEQECPYPDMDGRDVEPTTRHVWLPDPDRPVASYLRVLDDGSQRRIGRVVTDPAARSRGLAARLVEHALATTPGPWVVEAQAHLADWYARFGFVVTGPEYVEDGIAHVPMRREV